MQNEHVVVDASNSFAFGSSERVIECNEMLLKEEMNSI